MTFSLDRLVSAWHRVVRAYLRDRDEARRGSLGAISRRSTLAAVRRARRERRRLERIPERTLELPDRGRAILWKGWNP